MIVVDTTVLVYAVGDDHPLRDPCRRLVGLIGSGEVAATTTVEVIQVLAHVRARRRGREDAAAVAADFAALLRPLAVAGEADLRLGLDVFARSEAGAFNSVLAAVAMRLRAGVVSADRHFGAIPGIVHLDPAGEDLVERIRRLR